MCVAVPMKLVKVGKDAEAELDGLVCRVNVALIDDPQPGDYVIVHAGVAIEKLAPEAAAEQLQLWADLASVLQKDVTTPPSLRAGPPLLGKEGSLEEKSSTPQRAVPNQGNGG